MLFRSTTEKPSISFSRSGFTASGVTSRPVKPVPPVVMTTNGFPGLKDTQTVALTGNAFSGTLTTRSRAGKGWRIAEIVSVCPGSSVTGSFWGA